MEYSFDINYLKNEYNKFGEKTDKTHLWVTGKGDSAHLEVGEGQFWSKSDHPAVSQHLFRLNSIAKKAIQKNVQLAQKSEDPAHILTYKQEIEELRELIIKVEGVLSPWKMKSLIDYKLIDDTLEVHIGTNRALEALDRRSEALQDHLLGKLLSEESAKVLESDTSLSPPTTPTSTESTESRTGGLPDGYFVDPECGEFIQVNSEELNEARTVQAEFERYNSLGVEIYAAQIFSASLLVVDEVREEALKLKVDEKILETVKEQFYKLANEITEIMQKLVEKREFKALEYKVLSHDKTIIKELKDIKDYLQQVEKDVQKKLLQLLDAIDKQSIEVGNLKKSIPSRLTKMRLELIHNDPLWREPHRVRIFFEHEGKKLEAENVISPMGKPYSSTAPRNRNPIDAVPANFFREVYTPTSGWGMMPFLVFDAKRCAIIDEFDQPDPKLRKEATENILYTILESHAKTYLEKHPKLVQNYEEGTPVWINIQNVSLLTSDYVRKIGGSLGQVAEADNELQLLKNYLEAEREFNGKVLRIKLSEEFTIEVKVNILHWNIPCNHIHEKISRLSRFMASSQTEKEANQLAWKKLGNDAIARERQLEANIYALISDVNKDELTHQVYPKLLSALSKKNSLRMKILDRLKRGEEVKDLKSAWVDEAKGLAKLLHLGADRYFQLSPKERELYQIMVQLVDIKDVHQDLREIIDGGLIGYDAFDGNRYAPLVRVLILGGLLEYEQLFGCRSGKDRTGLLSDEVKIAIQLAQANGYFPPYWLQETLPEAHSFRNQIYKNSGSTDLIPRANLGAPLGLNIAGCFFLAKNHEGVSQLVNQRMMGGVSLFYRP